MKKTPDLSIVIPTHNRPRELVRSLESIINNIKADFDIIVVSDVRCQKTRDVLSKYLRSNDIYIEHPHNLGPAESRNLAFNQVKSPHVLIFDDDDQIPGIGYMDFLEKALSTTKAVTYSDVLIVQEDRERGILLDAEPERSDISTIPIEHIYVKNFIFTQSTIFPTHAIKEKKQDIHMRSLEDWEFLLQVAQDTEFNYFGGIGAVIYKDYINQGNRRGTTECAKNYEVVLDCLYTYRRWRAPTQHLKEMRSLLLKSSGLMVEPEFL